MITHTNGTSLYQTNSLSKTNSKISKSIEKLSSGYGINRASDDAAGLAMSEKMRSIIASVDTGRMNVADGMNLVSVADAALATVNDMLVRCSELSTRMANGTFSDDDRMAAEVEMLQIYEEIDNIFRHTTFNHIHLFQEGFDFSNFEFSEEQIVPNIDDAFELNGLSGLLSGDQIFNKSEVAVGASATLTFDDSFDPKYLSVLIDKSFLINGQTITIGPDDVKNVTTAEELLTNVVASQYYSFPDVENISVDGNTVTFLFKPADFTETVSTPDGSNFYNYIENGNGEVTNGIVISFSDGSEEEFYLGRVDGDYDNNNYVSVGETVTIDDMDLFSNLTDDDISTFVANASKFDINFGFENINGTELLSPIPTTVDDLKANLVTVVNNFPAPHNATLTQNANGKYDLEIENPITESVYRVEGSYTPAPSDYNNAPALLSQSDVTVQSGTNELFLTTTIQLPNVIGNTDDFSITINGEKYLFYTDDSLSNVEISDANFKINISGMSDAEIKKSIASNISYHYINDDSVQSVVQDGDSIVIRASTASGKVNCTIGGDFSYATTPFDIFPTEDYETNIIVPLDVTVTTGTNPMVASNLVGKGFFLNPIWYEFSDGISPLQKSTATAIDINDVNSLEQLADKMNSALNYNDNYATVVGDKIMLDGIYDYYTARLIKDDIFTDGHIVDGLFKGDNAISDGGTNVTNPYTILDFSKYDNPTKMLELVSGADGSGNSGFRITCATCEDEYINIIFCTDSSDLESPRIDKDPTTGEDIYTYFVGIETAKNGADIVANIKAQFGEGDHYTGMEIGTPESLLVVYDKRKGDMTDVDGNITQAGVFNGYIAPFESFSDVDVKVPPLSESGNKYETPTTPLYVHSGLSEFIGISLPDLFLETIGLGSPYPMLDTVEGSLETLKATSIAANTISAYRGILAADYNHLGRKDNVLAVMSLETKTAESKIRDTDMAMETMNLLKNNILNQSQMSIIANFNSSQSQVLELLQ